MMYLQSFSARLAVMIISLIMLTAVLCSALTVTPLKAEQPLIIFAAASLKNALDEISKRWQAEGGTKINISYAGSSRLARQILAGAPADIFISANQQWMDLLEKNGSLIRNSRIPLLTNRLVLISHQPLANPLPLTPGPDFKARLKGRKIAMAMVRAVPAGIYGKAALTSLGLWQTTRPHVIETENVRAALALVMSGEVAFGIVYKTDATTSNAPIAAKIPPASHPEIIYPAAQIRHQPETSESGMSHARKFLAYLQGPASAAIFTRHGFGVMPPPAPPELPGAKEAKADD